MFHIENDDVKKLIFHGNFGLEKESLRITEKGNLSHTSHPFPEHEHIVRDFCENQTEINTSIFSTPEEVIDSLYEYTCFIQKKLAGMNEYLWPFSNPPYIVNEEDIPVALFSGGKASKTEYRNYLSDRYGRYKMTFSGIHVNFSFSDELLQADFALSACNDFQEYKDRVYLFLAERVAAYSWILTAVTAASPILDSSFVEKGLFGKDAFNGMASTRCSELGYWNYFAPIFDYSGVKEYADSIQKYVDTGLIAAPSELYYPVRLKPHGENDLEHLRNDGIDHIELRMFDLNPLCKEGIDKRDLIFTHLLLIYLASTPRQSFNGRDQVQAVQNFKNAAHYDLKTVKIVIPNGEVYSVAEASLKLIGCMKEFYKTYSDEVLKVLDFEEKKFIDPYNRYAWKIRKLYSDGFVKKGIELARKNQEEALNV